MIAANVEHGARGVAVDKNIIQIGTFQIPIWALIGLICVVAVGLGSITWQLMPRGPKQMAGAWNIAVAPFVKDKQQGLFGRPATDNQYSVWVFDALQRQKTAFEELDPNLTISIWNDGMRPTEKGAAIGPIVGDTSQSRQQDARAVAERINANVVIYGNIDPQGNFIQSSMSSRNWSVMLTRSREAFSSAIRQFSLIHPTRLRPQTNLRRGPMPFFGWSLA